MNPFSDLLHRTPWWALVVGGLAIVVTLAFVVTPFHVIEYRKEGATPEENRAIKREIDNTFAEGAMDIAKSTILAMRGATSDPARREELDRALEELEGARTELREAGSEALRAKREALAATRQAARDAASAIEEAQRSAEQALKDAGVENGKARKALKESLRQSLKEAKEAARAAAKSTAEEAKKSMSGDAAKKAKEAPAEEAAGGKVTKRIIIDAGMGKDRPLVDIELGETATGEKSKTVEIRRVDEPGKGPAITIDLDDAQDAGSPNAPGAKHHATVVLPALSPEIRAEIRRNVGSDLKKIGVGAGLVLLFLPIFFLTIIAKFFIDRSRASQRVAEAKKKEAEYHRMSQQVTEAKLQALQAQVEPHFLYNTLANVQALTEVDAARANTMVGHLIQYLRNAMPKMRDSVSTVGQEVELVRAYLSILQMRMGGRLTFDISVPESLTATPFPPLMLPSLVENAIKHGLEPLREGGSVIISALAQDGRLRMIVSDTGKGFGEVIGTGIGLANIRERLVGLYGERAKLTLEANSPRGVIATIDVPLDGIRPSASPSPGAFASDGAAAQPAAPTTATGKVFTAVKSAERTWRKALSFTFVALVVVAAVVAGLGAFGVLTGVLPVQVGTEKLTGASGALLGAAGIVIAFIVMVLVLAIVAAIVYGLGWLFVALVIFVPIVVLIAISPALAPVALVGLLIWWLVRRNKSKQAAPAPAPKVDPVMRSAPAASPPASASAPGVSAAASAATPASAPAAPGFAQAPPPVPKDDPPGA